MRFHIRLSSSYHLHGNHYQNECESKSIKNVAFDDIELRSRTIIKYKRSVADVHMGEIQFFGHIAVKSMGCCDKSYKQSNRLPFLNNVGVLEHRAR